MSPSEPPVLAGAGRAPAVVSTIVVALYDPDSGRIGHVHAVHQHEGASEVGEATAVERAQHHARQLGHDVERLRHAVSSDPEHGSTPHRIDVESGEFIPLAPREAS